MAPRSTANTGARPLVPQAGARRIDGVITRTHVVAQGDCEPPCGFLDTGLREAEPHQGRLRGSDPKHFKYRIRTVTNVVSDIVAMETTRGGLGQTERITES